MNTSDGTLDEALERLHASGPERDGWLSNHAPMAIEALTRHGHAGDVHRWLDRYRHKLEDMPRPTEAVRKDNWRQALGDPSRITDWTRWFDREIAERPWRDVLAEWWPRLLPGITAAATHGAIRVGHAVHTLLADGPATTAPRTAELAHALGYWAARHQPLPELSRPPLPAGGGSAAGALAAVEPVPDQQGGIRGRFAQLTTVPAWPARAAGPEEARALLTELVHASTHRYATHGHGDPVMLVHAATAPNAVLRTLPALPHELWPASLQAAWSASAAVTAAYAPREPAGAAPTVTLHPGEVFERVAAHGDEHAIKLADTALDVAEGDRPGDGRALAAAVRACELIEPAR
ncbi:questin oxidase family protein [Streptomyces meridianus]|uniref:Questin oxidase family protein n=1 Tax=Streptomyces meridianus TaxID=2938945 RepID=A0ABT0X948_9ACTN|nr:questin oxidase family protein [Streptomyces meridianus]MCM2579057.1 questin oxidase family protein [Streptomyces meridianus]